MEVWCEEFSPETFFEQTALTFRAALRGRRKAEHYRAERDLSLAYQTGAFSGLAFNGKLKPFRHYAARMQPASKRSAALHFFQTLKSKGAEVTIRKVRRAG